MTPDDPIQLILRGELPVFEDDGRCHVQLGVSDRPTAIVVRLFRTKKKLTLDFFYPAGMREPRERMAANFVQVHVGRFSQRLLGLELDFSHVQDRTTLARSISRELSAAVDELKSRSADNIGARMNRKACEMDLKLANSVPPAWILEALDKAQAADAL